MAIQDDDDVEKRNWRQSTGGRRDCTCHGSNQVAHYAFSGGSDLDGGCFDHAAPNGGLVWHAESNLRHQSK